MGAEHRLDGRGGDDAFDWLTPAHALGIPLDEAHALYRAALRKATDAGPRRAEDLYLGWLADRGPGERPGTPGRSTLAMQNSLEPDRRSALQKPSVPGRRTLTEDLDVPRPLPEDTRARMVRQTARNMWAEPPASSRRYASSAMPLGFAKPTSVPQEQQARSGVEIGFADDRVGAITRVDALRALITGEVLTLAHTLALDPEDFDVFVDDHAASRLASAGVRGMQEDNAIYVHPDVFAADPNEGRYLLAHELIHAAQRTLPASADLGYRHAEAEATALGRAYAGGHGLRRPSIGLAGTAAAYEDPAPDRRSIIDTPLKLARRVGLYRITYTPKGDMKWIGGIDKKRQALASVLLDLVGPSAYSATLLDDMILALGAVIDVSGNLEGIATQNEAVSEFTVQGGLVLDMVNWLTGTRKLATSLTQEHLEALRAGLDGSDTWKDIKGALPKWATEGMYTYLSASTHVKELNAYAAAIRALAEHPSSANEQAVAAARAKMLAFLGPPMFALEAIRKDPKLAKEQAYSILWDMDPEATEAGKLAAPDKVPARPAAPHFLNDMLTDDALARRAPTDGNARKLLLERFSARQSLRDLRGRDGDAVVGQGVQKPSRAPLPGTLRSHPALEAPFYDTPKGGDREFVMRIHFPDVFEAFRGYSYKFEVLSIPQDRIEQLAEIADDTTKRGDSPGQWDVLTNRWDRDAQYGNVDIRRGIEALTSELGTPGIAALTLVSANAILRFAGTAIRTFYEALFKPEYEKTIPFANPGLYVVRCIAWPKPVDNALIDRVPTVCWMPIWVRPASDMSKLRLNLDTKVREGSLERLKEIQDELAKPPPPDQRAALEKERHEIEVALGGKGDEQLELERKTLRGALAQAKTDHEKKRLQERIAEIGEILRMRKSRVGGAKTDGTLEGLTRVPAAFVGDDARSMRPLFEVFQKTNQGKHLVYRAIDSTTKHSGTREGTGRTREAAIVAAIKAILESDQGYGRGFVTLSIPPAPGGVGRAPYIETIRIEKSLGSLAMEAVDNLASVAAIAAVAAAPFTGGASLALLVPIGVVGAIPSGYRLVDRASQGTLRLDMATALDIVNILGAGIGGGQIAAGAKAAARGVPLGKAWMILGLGSDGLGMAVAGAALIDQIEQATSDPNMPQGLRRAVIAQILGNQLTQLGMSVGARLSADGKQAQQAMGSNKHVEVNHAPVEAHLQRAFRDAVGPKGHAILVVRDAEGKQVAGDGVKIHYDLDGYGLPTNLRVIAGPNAGEAQIMIHGKAAKVMLEYQGLAGYLRDLLDRIITMFKSGKANPPRGSRAWNAKIELEKLPQVVEVVHADLKAGNITPEGAASKIADLRAQMRHHEQALNDFSEGPHVIAARDDVAQTAQSKGYPPPPEGHFYMEIGDGKFQLERRADSTAAPQHVVFENDKWALRPGEAPRHVDLTAMRVHVSDWLGVGADKVVLHGNATFDHVSVRPIAGGTYEVHFKPGTPEVMIKTAVDRHVELAAQRPKDIRNRDKKSAWNGAKEAEYLGRPEAAEGDHWALSRTGELSYHRGEAKPGDKPKMYDEKTGTVVDNPSGSVEEKLGPGLSKSEVFELLGGNDPSSPFGAWVKQVVDRLGVKPEILIEGLEGNQSGPKTDRGKFDGMTHRTVRHNLKEKYNKQLVRTITDIPDLAKSHAALLEVTRTLGSGDRGSIAEQWYQAKYATGAKPHVEFRKHDPDDPSYTKNQTPPDLGLAKDRVPDLIEGNQLKDVKHVKGALDANDQQQIKEYVDKLLDREITIGGTTYNLEKATVVFTEPEGGKKNADYIANNVSLVLEFEIFNSRGERRTINKKSVDKAGGVKQLAAEIKAWVSS